MPVDRWFTRVQCRDCGWIGSLAVWRPYIYTNYGGPTQSDPICPRCGSPKFRRIEQPFAGNPRLRRSRR